MRISERGARRRNPREKTRVKISTIFVIIIIAILAGYATTRFFIYPALDGSMLTKLQNFFGGENQEEQGKTEAETPGEGNLGIIEDGLLENNTEDQSTNTGTGTAIDETVPGATGETGTSDLAKPSNSEENISMESGYAIQFGSFSTKEAAEQLIAQLSVAGISAHVVEKDNAYKVLGQLFAQKEEAVSAIQAVDRETYPDIFITEQQEKK